MSLFKDFFTQAWKIKDFSFSTGFARVNIDRDDTSKTLISSYRFGYTFAKLVWGYEKKGTPGWVTQSNLLRLKASKLDLPKDLVNEMLDLLLESEYGLDMRNAETGARSIEGVYSMLYGIHGVNAGDACHLGYNIINILAQLEIFIHQIENENLSKEYHDRKVKFLTEQLLQVNESVSHLNLKSLPKNYQLNFSNLGESYKEFLNLGSAFDKELKNNANA